MVEAYWNIGKSIIEEQGGNEKAEYGYRFVKRVVKANDAGFWQRIYRANLKNMRQFY